MPRSVFGETTLSPVQCNPGEEFDYQSMQCVTAGQAYQPAPPLPTTLPPMPTTLPPIPVPPAPMPVPAPVPAPIVQAGMSPWLIGGLIAGGVVLVVAGVALFSPRRATPNRRRVSGKRCPVGTEVQTLIFDRSAFAKQDAERWARSKGFKTPKVDVTSGSYRVRQQAPGRFRSGSFRTISLTDGVKAVVGCPR